jgi:hypothetical protein
LATALVGLAAVLLVASMVSLWADDLLLSPSNWETTSTKLLANPTIRASAATYLADQVDARLQVSSLPPSALSSVLGPLAGTSVAATQAAIFQAMNYALGLPSVQVLWAQANRGAATAVMTVVNSPSAAPTVAGGSVSVNLGPVLQAAAANARLPAAAIAALPAGAGTLTILRSDQLHTVQTAGHAIRDLARGLVIAAVVLWLAALALGRGRRRRTLVWIGATAAVAGALVLGARALLVTPAADAISSNPSLRSIIAATITTITTSLGHVALGVGVVGLVVAVVAGLGGLRPNRPRYSD